MQDFAVFNAGTTLKGVSGAGTRPLLGAACQGKIKKGGTKAMLSRRSPLWILLRAVTLIVMSGLAATILIRLAPGFGLSEQALDPRLESRTLQLLEREHEGERNPFVYYFNFLTRLMTGNADRSVVFGQPVATLIAERAPRTVQTVTAGLALGWIAALLCAAAAAPSRRACTVLGSIVLSGSLLSVPSAVLATFCLLLELPPAIPIAAVIFPRVFPYAYEQLRDGLAKPHVLMARSRGLSEARVFLFHAVPTAVMPLLALAGVSVSLAFGASIPIEALADSPGLGQLAWRAALGRDLAVLVTITFLLTAATISANALADFAIQRFGRARV
jgi:peptide/nickel transport system permease protein